jgi:hypothetical protein
MTIDYSGKGKVKITMIPYIKGMLDKLPADMAGKAATSAASHLFQVNKDAKNLDEETAQLFHHNSDKLLFLCKWVSPVIQTAVAFLCTRVKTPAINDYKNSHAL